MVVETVILTTAMWYDMIIKASIKHRIGFCPRSLIEASQCKLRFLWVVIMYKICFAIFTVLLVSCDRHETSPVLDSIPAESSERNHAAKTVHSKKDAIPAAHRAAKGANREESPEKKEIDLGTHKDKWQVEISDVEVVGKVSKKTIIKAISPHLIEMKYCFKHTPPQQPGSVVIQSRISHDGKVIESGVVGGSVKNIELVRCMERTARPWNFPPSKDRLIYLATVRFVLSKESAD